MKRYTALVSALLVAAAASAQNLNPTVQVTNTYDSKLMDISKKELAMNVPDSLLRFDWKFDYSVFDNPYKGAYEFNPYVIEMKPEASVYDGRNLFVRAGLGYTFHPEAQVVWTPELKGPFSVTVYDDFKGYLGRYSNIVSKSAEGDTEGIDRFYRLEGDDNPTSGMDLANSLGTSLRYDAGSAILSLDGKFNFVGAQLDRNAPVNRNMVLGTGAKFSVVSNTPSRRFFYNASADVSTLGNNNAEKAEKFRESGFGLGTGLGYWVAAGHAVVLDASFGMSRFSRLAASEQDVKSVSVDVTPMYRFSIDRLSLNAGLHFSNVSQEGDVQADSEKKHIVYPHFSLSFEAVEDALMLTASLKGGQKLNTYSACLEKNHFLPYMASYSMTDGYISAARNTFDANLAASGRLGRHFQYRLDGGYARYLNSLLPGVMYSANSYTGSLVARFCPDMADYDLLYAGIDTKLNTDRFDASAAMRVQKTYLRDYTVAAPLSPFAGNASARYNWNRRVFAGVSAEWALGRTARGNYQDLNSPLLTSYECRIPGWVDLGINAEYRLNNRMSLWAEGGNLLGMTCQRSLFVAEKGPYFTLGLCLGL